MTQPQLERRATAGRIEIRTADDGTLSLDGYAAVFDSESFGEVVRRSAFNKTLAERDDVRLLVNHDGVPIARSKSGTLALTVDQRGLRVQADGLDPANPTVQELCSALARGDIDQMSFSFADMDRSVNDDGVRELKQVRLYDVSVVTYPWYEDTVVELNGRVLQEARSGRPDRPAVRQIARMVPLVPHKRDLAGWTINDLVPLLSEAIEETLDPETYWWCSVVDVSDTWAVYMICDMSDTDLWQVDFAVDDAGAVTLSNPRMVIAKTTYLPSLDDAGDANDESIAEDIMEGPAGMEMDSAPEEDIEARDAWFAEVWRAELARAS